MEKQKLNYNDEKEMNGIDRSTWNFRYKVMIETIDNKAMYDAVLVKAATLPYPHPVTMGMTIDDFIEADERLRNYSDKFLNIDNQKLESPQYDAESVRRFNDFVGIFGVQRSKALSEATTYMGFGEMYFSIYAPRNQNGIITVRKSTGNMYTNEIGLYGFTKEGFDKIVEELGLSI